MHGEHVHDRIAGPSHRLDIELSYSPQRKPLIAHGLIGQSFADPVPRIGRLDVYPDAGTFVTSAQAEGAIEGTGKMYAMRSPYETDFVFSRFAGEAVITGTAEAGMALCDKEFAQEVADVDRRLRNMALGATKQGIDGWRQFMREEAKATLVARATSLEVQPGEGMTEARRRLAEEPVCLPASSFALRLAPPGGGARSPPST